MGETFSSPGPRMTTEMSKEEKAERKRAKREKREAKRLASAVSGETEEDAVEASSQHQEVVEGQQTERDDKAERKRRKREKREARQARAVADAVADEEDGASGETANEQSVAEKQDSALDNGNGSPDDEIVEKTASQRTSKAAPTHTTEHEPDEDDEGDEEGADVQDDRAIRPLEAGPGSGLFTQREKATADRIFHQTCRAQKITEYELSRQLHEEWRKITYFKDDITRAFSNRNKASVRKFCLRRYNPHDQGAWTETQDQDLKAAYRKHPDRWVPISLLVGRSADSCRDRYRNYLGYGDRLEIGYWDLADERKLAQAVDEALNIIRTERPLESPKTQESYINWENIAKKMGGTRSRKRCMEKFRYMKKRGTNLETQASVDGDGQASSYAAEAERRHAANQSGRKRKWQATRESGPAL